MSTDPAPRSFEREDLRRARFVRSDLSGVSMREVDLSGAVLRAAEVDGAEVDAPWLAVPGATFVVNGVDVVPLVEAELDRRFPGRSQRRAEDPDGLRAAWAALERAWSGAVARARAMPDGTLDTSVDDEWSFAQTLRHLVTATDVWLRWTILDIEAPFHPIGRPHDGYASDGLDVSAFAPGVPDIDVVFEVRAGRVAMVREYLDAVTPAELDGSRPDPWSAEDRVTVRRALHVILDEEWSHLRYATRDLDLLEARAGSDVGPHA